MHQPGSTSVLLKWLTILAKYISLRPNLGRHHTPSSSSTFPDTSPLAFPPPLASSAQAEMLTTCYSNRVDTFSLLIHCFTLAGHYKEQTQIFPGDAVTSAWPPEAGPEQPPCLFSREATKTREGLKREEGQRGISQTAEAAAMDSHASFTAYLSQACRCPGHWTAFLKLCWCTPQEN